MISLAHILACFDLFHAQVSEARSRLADFCCFSVLAFFSRRSWPCGLPSCFLPVFHPCCKTYNCFFWKSTMSPSHAPSRLPNSAFMIYVLCCKFSNKPALPVVILVNKYDYYILFPFHATLFFTQMFLTSTYLPVKTISNTFLNILWTPIPLNAAFVHISLLL